MTIRLTGKVRSATTSAVVVIGTLAATLSLGPTSAAFTDTTSNAANSFASAPVGHDSLAHHWTFDGHALDAIGSADGSINGTTTVVGQTGLALAFDEVDDSVDMPNIAYAASFTIAFDFKIDDNTGALFKYIYSHDDINDMNSINIFLNEEDHGTDEDVIRVVVRDGDDTLDNSALQTGIASLVGDGQWHHFAVVVDAAAGISTYLDGLPAESDPTRGTDGISPSGPLRIGGHYDNDMDRFFGGSLDELKVFNEALSPAEIAALAP